MRYYGYLEDYVDNPVVPLDGLSIVTMCAHAPLIRQLERSSVPYINPARDFDGVWSNVMKPGFILDALEKVDSPYVLILDALDVVIDHLDDVIERFQTYGKAVLFGASLSNYPRMDIDVVEDRDRLGRYCHLNAGTCAGETEEVRRFYQKCVSLDLEGNEYGSEQFIVRTAFASSQEKVGFDWRRLCFQTMARAKIKASGRPGVEVVE
jgi:hypothetical protein